MQVTTPISQQVIEQLQIGDTFFLSGKIFCGRDAVLPRICKLIKSGEWEKTGIDLQGGVIFHTAVSPAGVGPTSSNKFEIESSFATLSKAGIKLHLGKGAISAETVQALNQHNAMFGIIPPVTALLGNNTLSQKCVLFPELGMEAFYQLEVKDYPVIVAAIHNNSIY